MLLMVGLNLPICAALWIEKMASKDQKNESLYVALHFLNILAVVVLPSSFVYFGKIGFGRAVLSF